MESGEDVGSFSLYVTAQRDIGYAASDHDPAKGQSGNRSAIAAPRALCFNAASPDGCAGG